MALDLSALQFIQKNLEYSEKSIAKVIELLFSEDCTIPFIARYRKEATGNLDEVAIRDIQKAYEEKIELEKRRAYILESIQKLEMLSDELKASINQATSLNQLEDLYAPYKSKKKTKAQKATEAGLKPLADDILSSSKGIKELLVKHLPELLSKKIKDFDSEEKLYNGALDIIIEKIVHTPQIKEKIRDRYWRVAEIKTEKRKKAEEIKDYIKFKDFFEFSEPISQLKDSKASHRYLAMRRAMGLKILKVEVVCEPEPNLEIINEIIIADKKLGCESIIKQCANKALNNYIHPSLDLEVKTELKKLADESAIDVFGVNLKNLLLQPYLGSKSVMGIDPGVRTGCKIVVIDKTGNLQADFVIYPFEPQCDLKNSKILIERAIEHFSIKHIAIGNGTNGRETLQFLENHIDAIKNKTVHATMISESGASIYSASDIAREEFPDKDVTVRGSVSIARRFQDPLAELVKIDPKSIGVGQYQHDVNQVKLKKSLHAVVENCVNYVGVDLNTASAPLLSFVSGIGPTVAKNIVKFRLKNGQFKNRKQLLDVGRLSQKVFEQSAGFLRIYNGENPLDGTFIHPEKYDLLTTWLKKNKFTSEQLLNGSDAIKKLESDKELKKEIGELTFEDIIKSLKAPTQDPRTQFKTIEFDRKIKNINDLKIGTWYTGVVSNITQFGAFVDIGIKENGLLHISQMSDEFVKDPLSHLKVGEEVKVKVLEIDFDRSRISLSRKSDDGTLRNNSSTRGHKQNQPSKNKQLQNKGKASNSNQPPLKNKGLANALKNFKV